MTFIGIGFDPIVVLSSLILALSTGVSMAGIGFSAELQPLHARKNPL